MSARSRVRVSSALDAMTDRQLSGGCHDCSAVQVVTKQSDGIYTLTVRHDDSCPWLAGAAQ